MYNVGKSVGILGRGGKPVYYLVWQLLQGLPTRLEPIVGRELFISDNKGLL